jgi:hypothetical protein
MIQAGTVCPIDGKIGKAAMELWKKYDFERPDYKAYVKRMKKREKVKIPNAIRLKEVDKITWENPK